MKSTILAIAFAVASMPLTFAAQTPAAKPAAQAPASQTAPAASSTAKSSNSTVKKSVVKKHSRKAVKDTSKPAANGGGSK